MGEEKERSEDVTQGREKNGIRAKAAEVEDE